MIEGGERGGIRGREGEGKGDQGGRGRKGWGK